MANESGSTGVGGGGPTASSEGRPKKKQPSPRKFVKPPRREHGIFKAQDGTSLYYEVAGEGRPLLFCYGLLCRRSHWRYQLEHFSKSYRVITFDYRGHHCSEVPANDRNLTVHWCASDVQDLIRHLELPEVVCLGHSLGVAVSAMTAEQASEVVRGMVLICGAVTNPFSHMFHSSRLDPVFRTLYRTYEFAPDVASLLWRRFTQRNLFSFWMASRLGFNPNLAQEEDVLMYMEGVKQTPVSTFFRLMRSYTQWDGRDRLKNIQCPALVIAGDADFITPPYVLEEIAQLLPKSSLEKISQGSHNAHMDRPDLVNQRIEKFLGEINYR